MLLLATSLLAIPGHVAIVATGRVLQGLSASVVWTSGLTVLTETFGPTNFGEVIGYVMMSVSISNTAAPLLGGVVYSRGGYLAVSLMTLAAVLADVVMRLLMVDARQGGPGSLAANDRHKDVEDCEGGNGADDRGRTNRAQEPSSETLGEREPLIRKVSPEKAGAHQNLPELPDNEFTHTFSTFVICLAPEPDRIVQEMYRVTTPGGVLGLGVWADPWFGYTSDLWTKACKQLDPRYERARIMDDEWTQPEQVKAGLQRTGFNDVVLTTERGVWEWENFDAFAKYFFDGGNPGNERMIDNWKALDRSLGEVRPVFKRIVEEEYGQPNGTLKGYVPAHLVTARK
ncbi:hypothetical protein OEA41_003467 [Lepraria neglecta]|uniref:Methyltransferase type 11 domain-containing protein n=1 Tax=Lepraria neglecta TaxID=209136 RepID=A0AAD9Z8G3_9LECA|nr:hypothetical protein OEA41_003467 [Lepraria neglecta]